MKYLLPSFVTKSTHLIPTLLGGFGIYSVYIFISNIIPNKEHHLIEQEIESLNLDQELFALFVRLQEFKTVAPKEFEIAVDCADNLVFLNYQLQNNEVQPVLNDRSNAFVIYKKCIHNLELLVNKSKSHESSRVPVEVHRIYMSILVCLERHWTGVLHLTQDVYTLR